MPPSKPEQRATPRLPVQAEVSIRSDQADAGKGLTRDLNRNGIFFYTDGQMREGSPLELVLMLPPELTNGEKQWVCCQASVLRVEESAEGGRVGVAASIQQIASLPEAAAK